MDTSNMGTLSGQPTVTNPLNRERLLEGRVSPSQGLSTHDTEVVREQASTNIKSAEVVNQVEENTSTGFRSPHFGNTIDITV